MEKNMENEMETVIIMGNKEPVHGVNTSLVLHVVGEAPDRLHRRQGVRHGCLLLVKRWNASRHVARHYNDLCRSSRLKYVELLCATQTLRSRILTELGRASKARCFLLQIIQRNGLSQKTHTGHAVT